MNPTIKIFPTKDDAAIAVGQEFFSGIPEETPVLALFSGGSCLTVLKNIPLPQHSSRITASVVDERNSPTETIRNFPQMESSQWAKELLAAGGTVFPFRKAASFEESLRKWRARNPNGIIVALLGMGTDGHIAGIFPTENRDHFEDTYIKSAWTATRTVPEAPDCPDRMTVSATFLIEQVDRAHAFIVGSEKRSVLEKALSGEEPIHRIPAAIFRSMKDITIYTDNQITN